MTSKIVFFDLETGGLDPDSHAIIQLGAVAVERSDFSSLETFERKLTFKDSAATSEALEMNSYDKESWLREAVSPPEAFRAFFDFLDRHATRKMVSKRNGRGYSVAELAGHNAATFDKPFLWRYASIMDLFVPAYPIPFDTLQLARWWQLKTGAKVGDLKLPTLAGHFDVTIAAHDALGDATACVQVARAMLSELGAS